MRRSNFALLAALTVGLTACGGLEVRDFDGDRRPPLVDRFEVLDGAGVIMASAVRRPSGGTTCPDGRALLGSSIQVANPVAGLLMTLKDDDSGVQRVVISVEGTKPITVAAATGTFELFEAAAERPARAVWRAELISEQKELSLRVPVTPSERIRVSVEVDDASGKSITTETLTFATLAALCG